MPPKPRTVLDLLENDSHFQKYRDEIYKDPIDRKKEEKERLKEVAESAEKVRINQERDWMINRGKEWMLDFW